MAGTGPHIAKTDTDRRHIGGDSFTQREAHPAWIAQRAALYETIQQRRQQETATLQRIPITVTLPDGTTLPNNNNKNKKGTTPPPVLLSYETTPYQVAACISQGLADSATVARVTYSSFCPDYSLELDGMVGADTLMVDDNDDNDADDQKNSTAKTFLWDMTRPLVGSVSRMEFLKFEADTDAQTVFWHSSAHMMGEALEHLWGAKLTIGPPLKGGFYYDSYMGSDALREEDCAWSVYTYVYICSHATALYAIGAHTLSFALPSLSLFYTHTDAPVQSEVNKIIKQKQKFERLVITKEEGLELFQDNPFKLQILRTKVRDRTTVYKCGDLIDLCRGPHVAHTGKVKAFLPTRHSATNWLGDTDHDSLQRMYGISFPDKKQLKVWKEKQELVCCLCCCVGKKESVWDYVVFVCWYMQYLDCARWCMSWWQ